MWEEDGGNMTVMQVLERGKIWEGQEYRRGYNSDRGGVEAAEICEGHQKVECPRCMALGGGQGAGGGGVTVGRRRC